MRNKRKQLAEVVMAHFRSQEEDSSDPLGVEIAEILEGFQDEAKDRLALTPGRGCSILEIEEIRFPLDLEMSF